MRLFIFETHPVQYHSPVYRELHRILIKQGGSSVHVVYGTDVTMRGFRDPGFNQSISWDEPLLQGYSCEVLNNERGEPLSGVRSITGRGIHKLLASERPDAVLLTNIHFAFDWTAFLSALQLGIPIWLRTETQDAAFGRPPWKKCLRSMFYRMVYSQVSKALVIGKLNADHYESHGMPKSRHEFSPYCVVDRFASMSLEQRKQVRRLSRERAGFEDNRIVLLFSGKLQPKKNPGLILDALSRMEKDERRCFGVWFLGSGELEPELRRQAEKIEAVKTIFAGFKNQTELPPYYLGADILVLPSRQSGETWGLVANEALLAEKRVILSKHVGCHADFQSFPGMSVFDGTLNGLVSALRGHFNAVDPCGQRHLMKHYSVDAAAMGIAKAMGVVMRCEVYTQSADMKRKTSQCELKPAKHTADFVPHAL
jgi:glycosyltransferase involved in cell wall biosynthesis